MLEPRPSSADIDVHRVATEMSTTPTSVKAIALEIMTQNALNPNRQRIGPSAQAGSPIKSRGMYVGMDIFDLSEVLTQRLGRKIDMHNVTHLLFDLQKQGLVSFGTSKNPSKLKRWGRNRAGDEVFKSSGGSAPQNIPIRIMLTKRALEVQGQEQDLKVELVTTDVFDDPRGLKNGAAQVHDVEVQDGTMVLDEQERVVALIPDALPPSPDRASGPPTVSVRLSQYPAVLRLYRSEQKIRQAAALLRSAGQNSLADMAEEALGERSAVEFETINLLSLLAIHGVVVTEEDS